MASWGSMRRSVIRLSSVSVRAPPRLSAVSQRPDSAPPESHAVPASPVELVVLGVVGGHGSGVCDELVVWR
jgi:hypothetical protein